MKLEVLKMSEDTEGGSQSITRKKYRKKELCPLYTYCLLLILESKVIIRFFRLFVMRFV